MARPSIDEIESAYYPPRARWYSRFVYAWNRLCRALPLDQLHLPPGLSRGQFLLGLIVPGFSFCVFERRREGRVFLAVYVAAALMFVIGLGSFAASIGFGLMIAAHASSIIHLLFRCFEPRFPIKVLAAIGTLLVVGVFIYGRLLTFIDRHWVTPVRVGGRVIVVWRTAPESLRRGDWAVFRIDAFSMRGLVVQSGFVQGPVLASGGDRVEFGPDLLAVNDVPQTRAARMPIQGGLVIPEKHWFLWPGFVITGGGNDAAMAETMVRIGTVSEDKFIGRPLKRWFWRRQIREPL